MWRDLLQPSHLLIVGVLLVILFGWKKLPDAARSVGRSMRIFKSEVSEMKNDGKEGRPSPAAGETVPGDVVPPPAPQQPAQQYAPQPPPQYAPQPAPQPAPQYAPQQGQAGQPVPPQSAPQPAAQPVPQPQPERHDSANPAL
ncbi:MAG: Sec-independent protein translocase subunit TatA [Lapillicoccus sp.]